MKLRAQIWCFGVMLLSILVSEAAGSASGATAASEAVSDGPMKAST